MHLLLLRTSCGCVSDLRCPPHPAHLYSATLPPGHDEPVSFGDRNGAMEMASRAALSIDDNVIAALQRAEYGGIVQLRGVIGPRLTAQMRTEAGLLRDGRQTGRYWEEHKLWYRRINADVASLGGYCGLVCALTLLSSICAEINRRWPATEDSLVATTDAQLACYDSGSKGFPLHSDGDSTGATDEDQRRTISARRVTAILYLNGSPWPPAHGGAFRGYRTAASLEGGVGEHMDIDPEGSSVVMFRSRDLMHEVLPTLPTAARRFALSLWFVSGEEMRPS